MAEYGLFLVLTVLTVMGRGCFMDVELGPKMLACSERERKFVWEYLKTCRNGKGDASEAARNAGYSDPGKHSAAIRVQGYNLIHRQRVLDAIEEVGRKAFRELLFPAVAAVERMINQKDHPDHFKAVTTTLSRLGLVERTAVDHNVSGELTVNHTDSALDDLRALLELGVARAKLEEIFGVSGLPRYERMLAEQERKAPKVIEHEP